MKLMKFRVESSSTYSKYRNPYVSISLIWVVKVASALL